MFSMTSVQLLYQIPAVALAGQAHGLTDTSSVYRHGVMSILIRANEDTRDTFLVRSRVIAHIRKGSLPSANFWKFETPMLQTIPAVAAPKAVRDASQRAGSADVPAYRRGALPQVALVVAGLSGLSRSNRNFRNEAFSLLGHNLEFTMLEFYRLRL